MKLAVIALRVLIVPVLQRELASVWRNKWVQWVLWVPSEAESQGVPSKQTSFGMCNRNLGFCGGLKPADFRMQLLKAEGVENPMPFLEQLDELSPSFQMGPNVTQEDAQKVELAART